MLKLLSRFLFLHLRVGGRGALHILAVRGRAAPTTLHHFAVRGRAAPTTLQILTVGGRAAPSALHNFAERGRAASPALHHLAVGRGRVLSPCTTESGTKIDSGHNIGSSKSPSQRELVFSSSQEKF